MWKGPEVSAGAGPVKFGNIRKLAPERVRNWSGGMRQCPKSGAGTGPALRELSAGGQSLGRRSRASVCIARKARQVNETLTVIQPSPAVQSLGRRSRASVCNGRKFGAVGPPEPVRRSRTEGPAMLRPKPGPGPA